MGNNTNPRILNLDDLEAAESDITIRHQGVDHKMRTLTVELFIAQQKRAAEHQRMVAAGNVQEDSDDITDVVTIIRDAVVEFFPTLPVHEIEVPKLFSVFAWLNQLAMDVNAQGAPEALSADEDAEGNVQEGQGAPS